MSAAIRLGCGFVVLSGNHCVQKVTLIMAMIQEATPIIEQLQLQPCADFLSKSPSRAFTGQYQGLDISLVVNGTDIIHNVECVGTQPATLAAYEALSHFQPGLLINAGTCGAFADKGSTIGAVYLGERIRFFDRRIPMGDYEAYGHGNYLCPEAVQLAGQLNIPTAIVCTGNALDMSPTDEAILRREPVVNKEMEAAAIAWVASLWQVPFIAIKSVTDLLDGGQTTADEFMQNLDLAAANLNKTVVRVLDHLGQ